jgi:hypothetical protein
MKTPVFVYPRGIIELPRGLMEGGHSFP